jgi:hypothetical protein
MYVWLVCKKDRSLWYSLTGVMGLLVSYVTEERTFILNIIVLRLGPININTFTVMFSQVLITKLVEYIYN